VRDGVLGVVDIVVGLAYLALIWMVPGRGLLWLQIVMMLLGAGLVFVGVGLRLGWALARPVGLAVGGALFVVGVGMVAAFGASVGFLWGIYDGLGRGLGVLSLVAAFLVFQLVGLVGAVNLWRLRR
jgi:hypothetical protein